MTKKDEWICKSKEFGKDAASAAGNVSSAVSFARNAGGGIPVQTAALVVSAANETHKMLNNNRDERVNTCVQERQSKRDAYEASITYSMDNMKRSYIAPVHQPRPSPMDYQMRQPGTPATSWDPDNRRSNNDACSII